MQVPNQAKRRQITQAAARMFASRPFHQVRLDDIAHAAKVGKGTLYVYFQSKDELYFSLIYQAFSQLVERVRALTAVNGTRQETRHEVDPHSIRHLRRIIAELVSFAFAHPDFYEVMREVGTANVRTRRDWDQKGSELLSLIEEAIRAGVRAGILRDPRPGFTARCITGMVRAMMIYRPEDASEKRVCDQILRLLLQGIASPQSISRNTQ